MPPKKKTPVPKKTQVYSDPDDEIAALLGAGSNHFRSIPYWLSTGISTLDLAIHDGIPSGRAVEIAGEEASCKTTVCLSTARMCQEAGGKVYYLDSEWGLSRELCKMLRVSADPKQWRSYRPSCIEDTIKAIQKIVKARQHLETPTLIVWDSVAGGTGHSNALEERDIDDNPRIGLRASLMTRFFESSGIMHAILDKPIFLIMTNQVRDCIGSPIPGQTKTPGGRCMRFWPAVRIRLDVEEVLQNPVKGEPPIGKVIKAKIIKNKVDRDGRVVSFPIYDGYGPDDEAALVLYAQKKGVIRQEGSWVYYGDKAWTRNGLRDMLRQDRACYEDLYEQVKLRMHGAPV